MTTPLWRPKLMKPRSDETRWTQGHVDLYPALLLFCFVFLISQHCTYDLVRFRHKYHLVRVRKTSCFVTTNTPADGSTPTEKTSVFCQHRCGFPPKYTCLVITNMAKKMSAEMSSYTVWMRRTSFYWISVEFVYFMTVLTKKSTFFMRRLAVLFSSFQGIWSFNSNSAQKCPSYTGWMRHICVYSLTYSAKKNVTNQLSLSLLK